MRKAVIIGLLATSLTVPVAAYAQAAPVHEVVVFEPVQWLAIGAGFVVGAAALSLLVPGNIAYIVGGVVGGYLADNWYDGRSPDLAAIFNR